MPRYGAARIALRFYDRWHSPRDWTPEGDSGRGRLSGRFADADNLWHRSWRAAEAAPAHEQPRLFEPATEAEKVLHYLETLAPIELFDQILPVYLAVAHRVLRTAADARHAGPAARLPAARRALRTLGAAAERACVRTHAPGLYVDGGAAAPTAAGAAVLMLGDPRAALDPGTLAACADELERCELCLARGASLLYKLGGSACAPLVEALLSGARPGASGDAAEDSGVPPQQHEQKGSGIVLLVGEAERAAVMRLLHAGGGDDDGRSRRWNGRNHGGGGESFDGRPGRTRMVSRVARRGDVPPREKEKGGGRRGGGGEGGEEEGTVKLLPPPAAREYVLRCTAPRPFFAASGAHRSCAGVGVNSTANRMYALLSEGEFRLALALSESSF